MGKRHFFGKNLNKYALYAKVFQPKTSQQYFNLLNQVFIMFHSANKEKNLANTDLTPTPAVHVIPCKY